MEKPNKNPEKAYRIKTEKCPHCGELLSLTTPALKDRGKEIPEPGDFTLCCECGTPFVFDKNMSRQPITAEQYTALPPESKSLLNEVLRNWAKDRESMRPRNAEIHATDTASNSIFVNPDYLANQTKDFWDGLGRSKTK